MAIRLLRTDPDFAALFMRLALGVTIFPHGAQKVLGWFGGHGPAATIQGLGKAGLPSWLVVFVMAAEFGGSILLILGFLTRIGAFGIGCVMAGAWAMVHAKVGFFMNWAGTQKGEGFEYHILALGLAVALLFTGGGALSVDGAVAGNRMSPASPEV